MFSAESCGPLLPEPPASLCFLMRFARCNAQERPAGPAPTIRTSASSCSRWTVITEPGRFYQTIIVAFEIHPGRFLTAGEFCRKVADRFRGPHARNCHSSAIRVIPSFVTACLADQEKSEDASDALKNRAPSR